MRAHAQHGSSSSSQISWIRLIVYHVPHLPQLLSVTRSVVSLSCCQLKAPAPSYTSLTHAAENQVRLVVLALFCCLLLSCPSSPLPPSPSPSCSPAGSSFLQVKLISLQVYWVILCLAVLSRCYFCLFVCQVMSGMKRPLFDSSKVFIKNSSETSIDVSTAARRLKDVCLFCAHAGVSIWRHKPVCVWFTVFLSCL